MSDSSSTLTCADVLFERNNASTANGGALECLGKCRVRKSEMRYNNAEQYGGAMFVSSGGKDVEVHDSMFHGCAADEGGAVAVEDTALVTVRGCNFTKSLSYVSGG